MDEKVVCEYCDETYLRRRRLRHVRAKKWTAARLREGINIVLPEKRSYSRSAKDSSASAVGDEEYFSCVEENAGLENGVVHSEPEVRVFELASLF